MIAAICHFLIDRYDGDATSLESPRSSEQARIGLIR
jgi:hypothetical protein